ncbi:MAG: lysozyme inhibitor LprI family protein [Verrucomicrobiae bacterium]|nr:lysozyme inhibitor LprI family protein [Verrucomicrobiae bacterium]
MSARLPLLLVLGCLLAGGCQSTPTPGKGPSQLEMNRKAAAEFEKADKRMQNILAELRSRLDEQSRAKLDASQKAWLLYRKAEAESYAAQYRDGSLAPLIYSASQADSTERRIGQLQFQLDDLKSR